MDKAPRQTLTAPIRRIRFAYVALFFCAVDRVDRDAARMAAGGAARRFCEACGMQQQRDFEVAPRRGMMYDRNLRELAVTVQVDSVFAVPSELGENRASAAEILAEIVHADPHDNFTSSSRCWRGSMPRGTLRGLRGGLMQIRRSGCVNSI